MMKRILIINPFGIGDVIFSTPLMEILKKHYQHIFIGYICNKRAYEVIRSDRNIDKIFIYEKDSYRDAWHRSKWECVKKILAFLGRIKKERFDIAIDLSLNSLYSMLLKFIGIRRRMGLNYKDRGRFLTDRVDIEGFNDKHVVEYYLEVLKPLNIGIKNYGIKPRVYLTGEDTLAAEKILTDNKISKEDILIGVIPGCGASWGRDAIYRRWSSRNFSRLADELIDRYKAKVILFGDFKEVGLCEEVQSTMKNKAVMLCGKTTIREFIGILARCKFVVTNDGGPLHIAAGLGVRTISIFGPVDDKVYGPYPKSERHIVLSRADMPCRPCYRKFKYKPCYDRRCLDLITPGDILKAIEKVT